MERQCFNQIPSVNQEPTYIDELEWDNLIILDACRSDLYNSVTGSSTPWIVSPGSNSPEFIEKTFTEKDFNDTVLITANPHFSEKKFEELTEKSIAECFHTVFHVYKDGWDSSEGTVLPDSVVERVETADKLFPDKRKIIWFMQPHHPFVPTDVGQGWTDNPGDRDRENIIWGKAETGDLTSEEVWKGYKKNLSFVMPYVERLGSDLSGRTVLTSDHGNLVGENGFYGHPRGRDAQGLRRVPLEVVSK